MPDDIGWEVNSEPMDLVDYAHDDFYDTFDQIVDPNISLPNKHEAHRRALVRSSCHYSFQYARGLMAVYSSVAVNTAGATYATVCHHISAKSSLNDNCHTVLLDSRNECRSVQLVRGDDQMASAVRLLPIR